MNLPTTSYAYDALGNITSTTNPDGTTVQYSRNYTANAVTVTDENGAQVKYTYTPLGLEYETVDVTSGLVISRKTYDSMSQLAKLTDFVYGGVTEYTYDVMGRIASETAKQVDTVLAQTLYAYDDAAESGAYQKVTKTVVGGGSAPSIITTQYTDRMGNIVRTGKVSNGTEHQDTYTYNYVGGLLTERTAASAQKGLAYTARYEYNGLRGAVKVYNSYDSLGNVITVSETDQETVVTKTDPLLQIPPDPTPDPELELYSITFPGGSGGGGDSGSGDSGSVQPDSTELVPVYAKNYAYDLAGNRVYFQLSVNGNAVENINYNYDALNRLIQVVGSGALQAAYTYDVNGNRATLTNGNGITTNYEYNLANWVTSMSAGKRGETLFDYSYAYYASGTQKSKTDIAGKTTSYVYDGLGRLTQESESGGTTLTYVYDRNSNRVQMRATGAESYVVNYTYDEANRLLSETGGKNGSATVTSHTYDGNGSGGSRRSP